MARPTKWRKIESMPAVPFFVPSESSDSMIESVTLLIEEIEAIRLKDLEGLEQAECAAKMEVSRPTFQRILLSAREKVADGLINGKTIHIQGGNYTMNICKITCQNCHDEWKDSFENVQLIKDKSMVCPKCGSTKVDCSHGCRSRLCGKECRLTQNNCV